MIQPVGTDVRPGRYWLLDAYTWNKNTGVAKLEYSNHFDDTQHMTFALQQPCRDGHAGWNQRPYPDHQMLMSRLKETYDETARLKALGAY